VERLNRALNSMIERDVVVLSSGRARGLGAHLDWQRRLRIARSDAEVGVYFVNWLVLLGLVLGSLALIAKPGSTPGTVFAQVTYLLAFVESWNRWPILTERLSQARDVTGRLARDASPGSPLAEGGEVER
jgi:hypothetical protein